MRTLLLTFVAISLPWVLLAQETSGLRCLSRFSNVAAGSQAALIFAVEDVAPAPEVLEMTVTMGPRTLSAGTCRIDRNGRAEYLVDFPAIPDGSVLPIAIRATIPNSSVPAVTKTVVVYPANPFLARQAWLESLAIRLYDPQETTAKYLERWLIPFKPISSIDPALPPAGILIVGAGVLPEADPEWFENCWRAAVQGQRVLCLGPAAGMLAIPEGASKPSRMLLAGLDEFHRQDAKLDTEYWVGDHPAVGCSLSIRGTEMQAQLQIKTDDPTGFALFDAAFRPHGGRVVVCGARLVAEENLGPAPRQILFRLLESLAPPSQESSSKP